MPHARRFAILFTLWTATLAAQEPYIAVIEKIAGAVGFFYGRWPPGCAGKGRQLPA